MIRLTKILNEQRRRSSEISLDRLIELYQNNCNEHKLPNQKIYRGIEGASFDFGYVNPKKFTRTSTDQADGNIYTLLLDNLPAWSEYPKRSKSIICSTSSGQASTYGRTYVVIPYDNAIFGVCPDNDIWYSFDTGIQEIMGARVSGYSLNVLNRSIDLLYQYLKRGEYSRDSVMITNPSSFSDLVSYINEISENIDQIEDSFRDDVEDVMKRSVDHIFSLELIKTIKKHDSFMDVLKKMFDPNVNDFELKKYQSAFNIDGITRELWTESESLLVDSYIYHEFIEELKKRGIR